MFGSMMCLCTLAVLTEKGRMVDSKSSKKTKGYQCYLAIVSSSMPERTSEDESIERLHYSGSGCAVGKIASLVLMLHIFNVASLVAVVE